MLRSTTLLSISTRPSSRNRHSPCQRDERVADRRGELGLLADELELGAQPGFEGFDQRPTALLADRTTFVGGTATDVLLDPVERCNARQRLGGDRRRARVGQLVEVPAHVAPAEGELHVAPPGQHLVAAIAVDLQDALEAAQMCDRPLGLAIRRIDVGNAGRIGTAPRSIVPGIGKELTGLGPSAPWIEHRRRRLVGEQLGRGFQLVEQPFVHGPQQEGCAPYPVGQGRAIQGNALARIDLGLSIERKMIGELRYQHLGDGRLGRQSAFDQPGRRRRLHDHVCCKPGRRTSGGARPAPGTGPARCPGAPRRPRRCDAASPRSTGRRCSHIDHRLDPRQMRRQPPRLVRRRAARALRSGDSLLDSAWLAAAPARHPPAQAEAGPRAGSRPAARSDDAGTPE